MSRAQAEWDQRFMNLLEEVRTWSWMPGKDGGASAVLVSPDRRQTTFGYAGPPRDCPQVLLDLAEGEAEYRDQLCRHAERNALSNAEGSVRGWTLYVSKPPCVECALEAHSRGIVRVVSPELEPESRWHREQEDAYHYMRDLGLEVVHLA